MINSEMFNKMLKNHMDETIILWCEEDINSSAWDSGEIGVTKLHEEPVLAYIVGTGTSGASNHYIYPLDEEDEEWTHPWVQQLLMEAHYRWYEAPHQKFENFHEEWENKVEYREY